MNSNEPHKIVLTDDPKRKDVCMRCYNKADWWGHTLTTKINDLIQISEK